MKNWKQRKYHILSSFAQKYEKAARSNMHRPWVSLSDMVSARRFNDFRRLRGSTVLLRVWVCPSLRVLSLRLYMIYIYIQIYPSIHVLGPGSYMASTGFLERDCKLYKHKATKRKKGQNNMFNNGFPWVKWRFHNIVAKIHYNYCSFAKRPTQYIRFNCKS